MSSLKYWVWLSALRDLRPKTKLRLIEAFNGPENVYFADLEQISKRLELTSNERKILKNKELDTAARILERTQAENISILTLNDGVYPQRLRNIYDPPIVLYIKGRLPNIDEEAAIGVVGTRKASAYGLKMAQKIGYEITKGGGLVVTGLAAGVDSESAKGALLAGGSCVGVLGCAINDVYPSFNQELYKDVAAVGALVSEYPPGTAIEGRNFPERNRIISGLSAGVCVCEAPKGSGALITASRALDQGREVFAIPGNADAPGFVGSNQLIKNGEAGLVTEGWDILSSFEGRFQKVLTREVRKDGKVYKSSAGASDKIQKNSEEIENNNKIYKFRIKNPRKKIDNEKTGAYIDLREQLKDLSENQLKVISQMNEKSLHVDDIIEKTGLSAAVVLSELTVLQIKGYVTEEGGKRFSLNLK